MPVREAEQSRESRRGITRGRAIRICVLGTLACLAALSFLPVHDLLHPSGDRLHLHVSGRGNTTTQRFQAPDRWQIAWSYDCGVAPRGTGSFVLSVLDADRTPIPPDAVSESGDRDASVVHLAGAGARSLQITSSCSWSVDVSS